MLGFGGCIEQRTLRPKYDYSSGTAYRPACTYWHIRPTDCRTTEVRGIKYAHGHHGLAAMLRRMSQLIHRVAFGELRRAEAMYEHATHQSSMFLHAFQYRIDGRITTRDIFLVDQRLCDHAVAVQQCFD